MSYDELPKVSLIVPCRNEERFIGKFLDSLCNQKYPKDKMEIIFVDGRSDDDTKGVIQRYRDKFLVSIIDNPMKFTPVALNLGIKNSSGDYVIILSSHTALKDTFIYDNIKTILDTKADCVGGIIKTYPSKDSLFAKGIAFVLSNKFGVGNSLFRTGIDKLMEVDTVPYGCYKRSVFDRIGYFNEKLIRNQDLELNLRLKNSGYKIVLNPQIESIYFARGDLKSFFKQNFQNGFWVFYGLKFAKLPFSFRHTIPAIFVLSLLVGIYPPFLPVSIASFIAYNLVNLYFTFNIAKEKGFKYLLPTFISFWILHLSYGIGSIWGLIRYIFGGKGV